MSEMIKPELQPTKKDKALAERLFSTLRSGLSRQDLKGKFRSLECFVANLQLNQKKGIRTAVSFSCSQYNRTENRPSFFTRRNFLPVVSLMLDEGYVDRKLGIFKQKCQSYTATDKLNNLN